MKRLPGIRSSALAHKEGHDEDLVRPMIISVVQAFAAPVSRSRTEKPSGSPSSVEQLDEPKRPLGEGSSKNLSSLGWGRRRSTTPPIALAQPGWMADRLFRLLDTSFKDVRARAEQSSRSSSRLAC